MLVETTVGGALGCVGAFAVAKGLFSHDWDSYDGSGGPILLGLILLTGAAVFGLAARFLRGTRRSSWVPQLMPLAIVTWIVWRLLTYSREPVPVPVLRQPLSGLLQFDRDDPATRQIATSSTNGAQLVH